MKILQKIKPGTEERQRFKEITDYCLNKIAVKCKGTTVVLGGSGAKDTWLSGNHDIDIFVLFKYAMAVKSKELADILAKSLRKAFPGKKIARLHGSRDYFQLIYEGHTVEVIPILKISNAEKAINITDVSPLHAKWVRKHARELKDDIRLAKQFCIAAGIYGAESYIQGFSGYVLEILIIHYGGFEKLLQAAGKWKVKQVIDTAKHYPKNDVMFQLNKSKLGSALIVIDPVDKSRNAAAALSDEKFRIFKKKAAEYLKKPRENYFVASKKDIEYWKKKKGTLVCMQVLPLSGKRDVVGAKLLKVYNYVRLGLEGFNVKKSAWQWGDEVKFYFVLEKNEIPAEEIRVGPPAHLKDAVKAFKKKNKDCFNKQGRVHARIRVRFPQLHNYIENLLKDVYINERVKKITFKVWRKV
jgi:tRNA nucleotidyltransferase (CCA-adding enzyme)